MKKKCLKLILKKKNSLVLINLSRDLITTVIPMFFQFRNEFQFIELPFNTF